MLKKLALAAGATLTGAVFMVAPAQAAGPVARFTWSPASPVTGQAVTFDGRTSSCSSTPCTYTWQDDGGDGPGGTNWPLGTGSVLTFTFQGAGVKHVRLTVRDHRGRSSTVEHDVTVTAAPPPPPPPSTCANALWCGDLETGDFSQYDQHQWSEGQWADQATYTTNNVGHSEADIITAPVKQGTYAMSCTVRPTTGTSASDRCEKVTSDSAATGDASQMQFYGWWTYFPGPSQSWWPTGGSFNDITQFGQYPAITDGAYWPYFGVDATSGTPRLYVSRYVDARQEPRNQRDLGVLQYDHWYHFVVAVLWRQDATGSFALWLDGTQVLDAHGATLTPPATSVHISQGIYRAAYTSTNTVIHDGLCRAATRSAAEAC